MGRDSASGPPPGCGTVPVNRCAAALDIALSSLSLTPPFRYLASSSCFSATYHFYTAQMQHTSQSLSWRKTLLRRLVIPYLILAIIVILSECYTLRLMEKDAPSLLKIGDDEIIRIRSIHSMPSWRAGAGAAGIWSAMTLIAFCYARNDFTDGAPVCSYTLCL